jgi:hypothetical protein
VLLVFATSDKGGTGRSVTSSNVLYQSALSGADVCYLDFDFGSPTAGAIFGIDAMSRGIASGGLHTFLRGSNAIEAAGVDVWTHSERPELRNRFFDAGRLVLFPGDRSGGEFLFENRLVDRCAQLFLRLQEEYDVCLVDLSAGRSTAIELALAATAHPQVRQARKIVPRWLVFHRWTRQHILAAAGLVGGEHGILSGGESRGHDRKALRASIRFVRTAVMDIEEQEQRGMRAAQIAWLEKCDNDLRSLAERYDLAADRMLGQTPLDPMLQWREQLITDADVMDSRIANPETRQSFRDLADALTNAERWEGI